MSKTRFSEFYDVFARACAQINIFFQINSPSSLGFPFWPFRYFFRSSLFSFSYLFAAVVGLLPGLLSATDFPFKRIRDRKFLGCTTIGLNGKIMLII